MLRHRLRHRIISNFHTFTGLMGSNNVELLRIFEIEETLVEMMQKEVLKVFGESDEAKKV